MALVGKRTAAAGGADATVTTAAGVHSVIDTALIAAGWTATSTPAGVAWTVSTTYNVGDVVTNAGNRYQATKSGTSSSSPTGPTPVSLSVADGTVVWRFLTKVGDPDKIYTSTGESGTETLFMRVYVQTGTGTTVNVTHYQYWDGTMGFNRIGPAANAISQHTFTAGNTVNYALVADKDSFVGVFNDSANNRRVIGGGRLVRAANVNGTTFVSNATVTAGTNRTISFASGNPIASGYKLGDRVFVVAQQGNGSDPFDPTIPLYAAKIVALTTTSITIDVAQETTSAGALVGGDPMPLWYLNNTVNTGLNSTLQIWTNYRYAPEFLNLYTAGTTEQGYSGSGGGRLLVSAAATELDPNNRTGRVGMGEHVFLSAGNELCGIVPKYYWQARTTDALWTIGRSVKETSNFDYVTFPVNTASPAGQIRETIGPFAISGSAGYTIDLFKADNNNSWIEAETHEGMSDTFVGRRIFLWTDRPTISVPFSAAAGHPFQGENSDGQGGTLIDSEGNVSVWALYMPNLVSQESDRTGRNQYIALSSAEALPFDSPSAVIAGTGSGSSFNSGFN
jgi:hypothetical protein